MGELAEGAIIPCIISELNAPGAMQLQLTLMLYLAHSTARTSLVRPRTKGYTLLGDQATLGGRELEARLRYRRRQKGTTR